MVSLVKKETGKFATKTKQPGLFTGIIRPECYYGKTYTFTGILRKGILDPQEIQGTHDPNASAGYFYYIEIAPIDILPTNGVVEKPLDNVTMLQIDNCKNWVPGQKISVTGQLNYRTFFDCYIYTIAFLKNCVYKGQQPPEEQTYHFNVPNTILRGKLTSELTQINEPKGKVSYLTLYYLELDQPISVKHKSDGNPTLEQLPAVHGLTKVKLLGIHKHREFLEQRVIIKGRFQTATSTKDVGFYVTEMMLY